MSPAAFASSVGLVLLFALPLHAGSLLETMDKEVAAHYQRSKDAIAKVHAEFDFNGYPLPGKHRVGTGFFVDGEGRLLTSASVVEGTTNCWVEWRGEKVPAKFLGRDPLSNLALLQVAQRTPFLVAGNSDELQVGSMVIAIGFPYDQPSEPTVGWVSGFDIKCGARTFVTRHFRAGCRLRPGQGGGPLLNARGEVVGIAVAAHQEDQCYALPMNAAKKIVADLRDHGVPQYGWIGLSVTERPLDFARYQVFIEQVYSNTPAAAAGFQNRDVLLTVHTNAIQRAADVLDLMFHRAAGEQLAFSVLRQGTTQEVRLVVGTRPVEEPSQPVVPRPVLNVLPACATPGSPHVPALRNGQ
jgi:serine protease Do